MARLEGALGRLGAFRTRPGRLFRPFRARCTQCAEVYNFDKKIRIFQHPRSLLAASGASPGVYERPRSVLGAFGRVAGALGCVLTSSAGILVTCKGPFGSADAHPGCVGTRAFGCAGRRKARGVCVLPILWGFAGCFSRMGRKGRGCRDVILIRNLQGPVGFQRVQITPGN